MGLSAMHHLADTPLNQEEFLQRNFSLILGEWRVARTLTCRCCFYAVPACLRISIVWSPAEMLPTCQELVSKTGLVFCLHCLYNTQCTSPKVKIRVCIGITLGEGLPNGFNPCAVFSGTWSHVLKLHDELAAAGPRAVHAYKALRLLHEHRAFHFCSFTGPEGSWTSIVDDADHSSSASAEPTSVRSSSDVNIAECGRLLTSVRNELEPPIFVTNCSRETICN
jgi:hypothetical protein